MSRIALAVAAALELASSTAWCQFKPVEPRTKLETGEIPVTEPGIYAESGKTYVLMKDIRSPATTVFLGKDVTLDLNGHTLSYADGDYEHVPNYSFEQGLKGWDLSKAPGAKAADRRWINPIDGNQVCVLPEGQEIVSPYITLPVANRAYYAMALVASEQSEVQIRVQNEKGVDVDVKYKAGSETREGVPVTGSPRLGGGGVIGLFSGLPAGKYRIRVKATKKDAIIDSVDIRPAMDAGVGIVGTIRPFGYFQGLYDGELPKFYDYSTDPLKLSSKPRSGIPVVSGGKVTVKNGVIRSGFAGVQSTGLLCSSADTTLVVENVKFEASGINTNGLRTDGNAQIRHCRFEIDTPFIINRHVHDMAAVVHGRVPSEIAYNEFIGGQGNLAISGDESLIHHNLFVNAQTVTNHYSLGANASRLKIYNNRFEPRIGSALYIYRNRGCEVYDNTFNITGAPPNNEYAETDYSTSAIRISDYNEKEGSKKACVDNKIYRNKIKLTGMSYPQASKKYMAMTYGIFMSVGGGLNYVYDNDISVDNQHASADTGETYAFYVGGSDNGGVFHNNRVVSNNTFFWIANRYGAGTNVQVYNNTLVKAPGASAFPAIRLGWSQYASKNVQFTSNQTEGMPFDIEVRDTKKASAYELGWTLTVITEAGEEVTVQNADSAPEIKGRADAQGQYTARLPATKFQDGKTVRCEDYVVKVGSTEKKVKLVRDTEIRMK